MPVESRPAHRTGRRAAEQPVEQSGLFLSRLLMSRLLISVAVNFAVVILFFAAAVLMTVGMLGMR